MIVTLV